MTHKLTANTMILTDLRDAGFEVAQNLNGNTRISLNRPVDTLEVKSVLRNAGYEDCQFRTYRIESYVIVEAVTT